MRRFWRDPYLPIWRVPAHLRRLQPRRRALNPDHAVGYCCDAFDRFADVSNGPTFTYSYVPSTTLLTGYTNDLGLAIASTLEPSFRLNRAEEG